MPWVESHRRRVPGSLFRRATVRRHYRMPAGLPLIPIAIGVVVLLVILALVF
ncbi:hypothetical protein ACTG9Q_12440 [Actinokineospora sp. 24-640]|jgi:hypothetical protein